MRCHIGADKRDVIQRIVVNEVRNIPNAAHILQAANVGNLAKTFGGEIRGILKQILVCDFPYFPPTSFRR